MDHLRHKDQHSVLADFCLAGTCQLRLWLSRQSNKSVHVCYIYITLSMDQLQTQQMWLLGTLPFPEVFQWLNSALSSSIREHLNSEDHKMSYDDDHR